LCVFLHYAKVLFIYLLLTFGLFGTSFLTVFGLI